MRVMAHCCLLGVIGLQGCIIDEYTYIGPDRGVPTTTDALIRDTGVDSQNNDSGLDGGDVAVRPNTFVNIAPRCVREAGVGDASVAPSMPDYCSCASFGPSCSVASPCSNGSVCLNNGCGTYCLPAGARCTGPSDCPAADTCSNGVCTHPGTACVDSRDCPAGFACEAGGCVDRRIPCQAAEQCPWGYMCVQGEGFPHCEKLYRSCANDATCGAGFSCFDIDGVGGGNCVPSAGVCAASSQCNVNNANSCGTTPINRFMACVPYGPCRDDTGCSQGMRCLDLWGDGNKECAPATGDCESSSMCPNRRVCGVRWMETRLSCIGGMYPAS